MKTYIETERLILREWIQEDLPPFIQLNQNLNVMEFFPNPLSKQESVNLYNRISEELKISGYGLFALERKEDKAFIGFTGLHHFSFNTDFSPGVEISWRILPQYWGKGYVPEAGIECLRFAKEKLKLSKVYSFTSLLNKRSERVMQKIGMSFVKEFNHPSVDTFHPLLKHVLYESDLNDI